MIAKEWKLVADSFIVNYYNFVDKIADKIDSGYVKSFSKWIAEEGERYFDIISTMEESRLDNRVESFVNRYNRVMERAFNENDFDKLLDYLYFVPGEMLKEFKSFKFIPDKITVDESEHDNYNRNVLTQGALLSFLFL